MQVLYSGELSRRRERFLRAGLRRAIGESVPTPKIEFVRQPETFGQVSVTVDLAEGEVPSCDLLELVFPVVDTIATREEDAKCTVKNCGKIPVSTRHRWSSRPDAMHWK